MLPLSLPWVWNSESMMVGVPDQELALGHIDYGIIIDLVIDIEVWDTEPGFLDEKPSVDFKVVYVATDVGFPARKSTDIRDYISAERPQHAKVEIIEIKIEVEVGFIAGYFEVTVCGERGNIFVFNIRRKVEFPETVIALDV